MACTTLASILKGCDNNLGGIYTAYIFDMDDIATVTEDPATWTITALTLGIGASAESFEFKRNTSNYLDEKNTDLINGSSFWTKTVNLVFHKRDAAKSKAVKILGEGQRYLGVVIGDANGLFWYFPYLQLITATGGSGTAKADGSNYNITLVGEDTYNAKTVSSVIAAALLIPVS